MQHQLSGNTASHQTATFTQHIFCRISNTKVEIFMTSFNLSLCDLHCHHIFAKFCIYFQGPLAGSRTERERECFNTVLFYRGGKKEKKRRKKKKGLKAFQSHTQSNALYNETDKNQQQPRFSLAHLRLASFTALHRSVSETVPPNVCMQSLHVITQQKHFFVSSQQICE